MTKHIDTESLLRIAVPFPVERPEMRIENWIAWLAQQNPAEAYDFQNPLDCPLARYFTACGYVDANMNCHDGQSISEAGYAVHAGGRFTFPPDMLNSVKNRPHTYGAALSRARGEG